MNYAAIDPIISAWAAKHSFTIYKQYRDEEVRSVNIVSPTGRKYQIWIDPPKGETVSIHAWDYKKQRQDWDGTIEQLSQNLEEASKIVCSWMT